jgi:hypothetical protein
VNNVTKMKRKIIKGIILALLALVIVIGFFKIKRFFEIDKCLDAGGRWNYETNQCEYK